MNIAEILKDAPIGAYTNGIKLYSPMFGDVELMNIFEDGQIEVSEKDGTIWRFKSDGSFPYGGEIMLFPSKENRDWSTFKVEPQFPMTYEECCKILDVESIAERSLDLAQHPTNIDDSVSCSHDFPYHIELNALFKLLICRDAWRKVDGDWKPDWGNNKQDKHYISSYVHRFSNHYCNLFNRIMVFSTAEIRDKFFGTFKHLIEQCKEFI